MAHGLGTNIIEAILSGEREPETLYAWVDARCESSKDEIMAALEGTWDDDHMFALSMAYGDYKTAQANSVNGAILYPTTKSPAEKLCQAKCRNARIKSVRL